MQFPAIATIVVMLTAAAPGVVAQPTLLSQNRTIRAGSATLSAPAFSLFDEEVSQSGDDCGGYCIGSSASASQISEITTAGFFADAGCGASGGSVTDTSAATGFQFSVEINAATTLSLSGTIRGSIGGFDPPGFSTGSASLTVTRDGPGGGEIASWSADGFDGFNGTLNIGSNDLMLTPGTYSIDASASASGLAQTGGNASFDIVGTFEPDTSCPADLTGDGIADLADVQFFIESFVAGLPAADLNSDGVYDLADVQGFITIFIAGCP